MFDEKSYNVKMDKAIEVFTKELSSLRTGRANAAMLDLVRVDVYGQQMPINQVGSITTPEPRMINIQVWDANNVPLVDASIKKSDLGLNPQIDGQLIRLPVPELNEERRTELKKLIKSIGEKITIGKAKTIENSGTVNNHYLHTVVKDNISKLAVIVSLETKDNSDVVKNFGKQLSMHIAASNPLALTSDLIDQSVIDKEQELVTEELKNSGKPEDIAKKISLGKMNKFKEENSLLTQAWVMEPKKKVQDIVKELSIADLKIKEFYRIKIGE